MKKIVIDLDGTLTVDDPGKSYPEKEPREDVIDKLREYRDQGYGITILTARNMRTYEGNVGLINVHTLPLIVQWLERHGVPYDEIVVGKPWCGTEGFYVDDRCIRPDEFVALESQQVAKLIARRKP